MSKSLFHDDTAQTNRAARQYLKFIFANKKYLLKRRNGKKHLEAMESISKVLNDNFSPKQKSYIDSVYEMVMKGLGFPSYKGQKSKYGVNLKC